MRNSWLKYASGVIKKALLLEAGFIQLLDGNFLTLAERSTAGPDAGFNSIFLKFDRYRVRMATTQKSNETPFLLKKIEDGYQITNGDSVFIKHVTLEKPSLHAPNQIFLNLSSTCIFNCKFCATPKLKVNFTLKPRNVLALIKSAMASGDRVEGIALTSGIVKSEDQTIKLMIDTVKRIRKEFGHQIPIGVEPYITKESHIDALYSSGVNEIKVNVESFDRAIMRAICPELDYNAVLSALQYSIDVFGKNRVCSNVLIGLGETNDAVLKGLEWMAEIGAVANLKPLFISHQRSQSIAKATQNRAARPSATRMLNLASSYQSILEKYGLKTFLFHTMCYKCTGCEIAPQQDL